MQQALTYICPFCGHEVRVGKPCRSCSKKQKPTPAKARRYREPDETYDALDLPDEDFDYDKFVAREFGREPHKKLGLQWYWWLLGVVLLVVMSGFMIFGC